MTNLEAAKQELKGLIARGHGGSLKARELRALITRLVRQSRLRNRLHTTR